MTAALYYFDDEADAANRLGAALGMACHAIDRRQFPDGESLIRITEPATTAFVYRSLCQPNDKLVELLLVASALRDRGAARVILVAPYLAYMRQDVAFLPGQAVSQRVITQLIADHFQGLVTVDPHLHRTPNLEAIAPQLQVAYVSAAGTLAEMLRPDIAPGTIMVGPDGESRPWVESVAKPLGCDVLVGEKVRFGDREVELTVPGIEQVAGRPVILVDDMISTGGTLLKCAALLQAAGATRIEAVTAHCLASHDDLAHLEAGGIQRVRATDTVAGVTVAAAIAPALAAAIREKWGSLLA